MMLMIGSELAPGTQLLVCETPVEAETSHARVLTYDSRSLCALEC